MDPNLNGNSEYITVKSYTFKLYLPIIRSYKGVNSALNDNAGLRHRFSMK